MAIAWSPQWHGRLDGRRRSLRRTSDGLIELDIPPGDHQLQLAYRPDGWDRLGLIMTALTLAAVFSWRFSGGLWGRSPLSAS